MNHKSSLSRAVSFLIRATAYSGLQSEFGSRNSEEREAAALLLPVICHLSSVICHLSSVICHLSSVICHLSSVICHLSSVICLLSSVIPPSATDYRTHSREMRDDITSETRCRRARCAASAPRQAASGHHRSRLTDSAGSAHQRLPGSGTAGRKSADSV